MSSGSLRDRRSACWTLTAMVVLCACSACDASPYRASNQQRVVGDGNNVFVTSVHTELEGRPFAEEYCEKRDRTAQFTRIVQYRHHHTVADAASFECVPRAT